MQKKLSLIPCLLFLCILQVSCQTKSYNQLNLDFENLDSSLSPVGWKLSSQNGYMVKSGLNEHEHGKISLLISKTGKGNFGSCSKEIIPPKKGSQLEFSGFIKTESVDSGYGGLWIRVQDNVGRVIAFDNMKDRGITGTNNWKEYDIKIPYNADATNKIVIGALLTGTGKIWVDDLHLRIDGKEIQDVEPKDAALLNTNNDGGFGTTKILLTPEKTKQLTNLGMIWGFLKYYHPAIAKGKYDWDAELLKVLPRYLAIASNKDFYNAVDSLVDKLGPIPVTHDTTSIGNIKLLPDYGYLFSPHNLPDGLMKKLSTIRDNYVTPQSHYNYVTPQNSNNHYYIDFAENIGNPVFKNEVDYNTFYPNVGVRLIALYRYWNIIQYFFPSRHLIKEDWNKVFSEFVPKFINAKDKKEYVLACLELISHIHDTHANIYGNPVLDSLRGMLITPFQAKFIENKLVVTGCYNESVGIGNGLAIGDVIEKIDNVPVDSLVKKWLPFTPASNYETQLRDLPSIGGFLLRSNKTTVDLIIIHLGKYQKLALQRIPVETATSISDYGNLKETKGYRFINNDIGYIYPAKLKDTDIGSIKLAFKNTKGLVIDLRDYPSSFMPFTYGQWLKPNSTQFVHFTTGSLAKPGVILNGKDLANGGGNTDAYKGKVVIIVNAITQSQAEYTTMALSGKGTNSVVLGSTTAGADGNISQISLPGGILTYISGIGVYYPDLTETQRAGVKIDILVKPTIKGVEKGIDELLEKAVLLINTSGR